MRIGIDIDDTMTNLTEYLIAFGELNGGNLKHPIIETSLRTLFEWDNEEKLNLWKENIETITYNINPRPLLKETLIEIKKQGIEIYIISVRGKKYYEDAYLSTTKWLEKNNLVYDKLILTSNNKGDVCFENNIDAFIDDRPLICDEVSSKGIKTFIFDNVFNKDYFNENVTRIYSFPGFFNEIKKEYKLLKRKSKCIKNN